MTTNAPFSMASLPETEPSICIPRIFHNIDWKKVKGVFEEVFTVGCIDRVDMVERENTRGEKFKRVFVHFKKWPENTMATAVRQRLMRGDTVKIVYDEPWFWKCSASRVPKPTGARPERTKRPYVKLATPAVETGTHESPKKTPGGECSGVNTGCFEAEPKLDWLKALTQAKTESVEVGETLLEDVD